MACVKLAQQLGKGLIKARSSPLAISLTQQHNCCRLISTQSAGKVRNKLKWITATGICSVTSLTCMGLVYKFVKSTETDTVTEFDQTHAFTQSLIPTVYADGGGVRPTPIPTRRVTRTKNTKDLKLTLYQYESCPFCCKVRAVLDYYGFSYDVVEVDAVRRTQIKWSKYGKLPLLVFENVGKDNYVQVHDSSLIASLLKSYLQPGSSDLTELVSYYPCLESENKKGKKIYEYPNRYFVMLGDSSVKVNENLNSEEREWRRWVDEVLMHVISPNIYRSVGEAKQAVNYFAQAGEWKKNFSAAEYWFVVVAGPYAMYLLGKSLKKRYNLKEDVRQSLYDACSQWSKALGGRQFMGGESPNLADLSVYGVLSCMEGCDSFTDMMTNTSIGNWYNRTKESIRRNAGVEQIGVNS